MHPLEDTTCLSPGLRIAIHVQTCIESHFVATKFQGTVTQATSCVMNLDYVVSVCSYVECSVKSDILQTLLDFMENF